MTTRKIIRIDEEKCNGCGLCIPACAEGAIEIREGKARLVSEKYCDGLGACLGECPEGAITIEDREAQDFDEKAVEEHLLASSCHLSGLPSVASAPVLRSSTTAEDGKDGCPSARVLEFESKSTDGPVAILANELTHWPVQLKLVPPTAPYLRDAHLLVAADCVPFVYAAFHQDLLKGRVVLVGCPMLDDAEFYVERLAEIFKANNLKSVTVAHVEVPCCFGLKRIVEQALKNSGKDISVQELVVGVKGELKRI